MFDVFQMQFLVCKGLFLFIEKKIQFVHKFTLLLQQQKRVQNMHVLQINVCKDQQKLWNYHACFSVTLLIQMQASLSFVCVFSPFTKVHVFSLRDMFITKRKLAINKMKRIIHVPLSLVMFLPTTLTLLVATSVLNLGTLHVK